MTLQIMRAAYRIATVATFVFLLLPLFFVVAVSFNSTEVQTFPPDGLSLRWYEHAFKVEAFTSGAWTSTWLASAATAIATPLGTAAALGISRVVFAGKQALERFLLAPLIVPGLVIGISLLVAFARMDIEQAPMRLIIGHTIMILPYPIRTVLASLTQLDRSLEEAARTLGASNAATFWFVTLPQISGGIIAGAVFGFILSFDDVSIALFLTDARTSTLPLNIMSYI